MKARFTALAWEDYEYWQQTDHKILRRIQDLIADIQKHPTQGIGRPLPLREKLAGCWVRRISEEHRLVYCEMAGEVVLLQLRQHYRKPDHSTE